jgi:hypothetical protein
MTVEKLRDVSQFFELSYAQFLTIPRIFLEHMPPEWQTAFVRLLDELDETFDWRPAAGRQYWVTMRSTADGKFLRLPCLVCDYRRGNIEHLRKKTDDHA